MKKIILLLILLSHFNGNAQELKIISVKEYSLYGYKQYLITCELKNNSKTDTIVLPIPLEAKGEDNTNDLNYFYSVVTNPKEAIVTEEHPPFIQTKTEKLTAKNIIVCTPNSTIKFEIDTKCFMHYAHYFDDKIKIKQIRLIYSPLRSEALDKEESLSEEIINTDFYNKEIRSKFFEIRE